MLSSRKKRPLDRAQANRDASLIIIAAEGEKTEQIYFNSFSNVKVKIIMISSMNGKSAPNHVFDNMQSYVEEYSIGEGDELWLVIDRDAWKEKMLSEIAASCIQKNIKLAVSNPCFELWLAHHLENPLPSEITCNSLGEHLKLSMGGYSKSNYNSKALIENVRSAIERAVILDNDPSKRWPDPIGSRVHSLVSTILSLY